MIDFTVKPDGGDEYKVTAVARDILQWEKGNRGVSFNGLMRDMQMVHLYKLAHLASRRQGLFTGSLPEFEASCDLTYQDEDEDGGSEPDPTQPAH